MEVKMRFVLIIAFLFSYSLLAKGNKYLLKDIYQKCERVLVEENLTDMGLKFEGIFFLERTFTFDLPGRDLSGVSCSYIVEKLPKYFDDYDKDLLIRAHIFLGTDNSLPEVSLSIFDDDGWSPLTGEGVNLGFSFKEHVRAQEQKEFLLSKGFEENDIFFNQFGDIVVKTYGNMKTTLYGLKIKGKDLLSASLTAFLQCYNCRQDKRIELKGDSINIDNLRTFSQAEQDAGWIKPFISVLNLD